MRLEALRMTNVTLAGLRPGDAFTPYLTSDVAAAIAGAHVDHVGRGHAGATLVVLSALERVLPNSGLPVVDVVALKDPRRGTSEVAAVVKLEFVSNPNRPVVTSSKREWDVTNRDFFYHMVVWRVE